MASSRGDCNCACYCDCAGAVYRKILYCPLRRQTRVGEHSRELLRLPSKRRDGHGKWDKDEAGAETGYPLSKDVLRKMESARRRATKKAPGSG